ncbi:MAG TPA: sigma-70 family RNA polymerase sigma factor [Candidatus Sulfomarinibacteraceae bacterium]|nr:sigma-70 family RNA polymerase sigma factor [Candidatus Sulfomarinibacteraceae bacterium]
MPPPWPPDAPGDDDLDDDLDDGALVRRVAGGDEAAFMSLYDRHAVLLFGTTVRFLRDREAAAEVVQETFLAAWQRAAQFDAARGSIAGWLIGIARNRALDRLRAEGRRPRSVSADSFRASPGEGSAAADRAGPVADEPEAAADRHWLRALLRTSLGEMRPEEREVLVLAYDRELSQAEIADRLGLPIGTVKSRTRRALSRLRAYLADVPDLRDTAIGRRAPGGRHGFGPSDRAAAEPDR